LNTLNIKIYTPAHSYPILLGENLLEKLTELYDFRDYTKILLISDSNVGPIYAANVRTAISKNYEIPITEFESPAGEKSKLLKTITKIWEKLSEIGADRKSLVINLGGGITTDMGGFAASCYMRGINFINIATSLEAMVDASIGGKTGINLGSLKNHLGTFAHPKCVIMDIQTLTTLSKRDLIAAFAEIIKHGLIADAKYFDLVKMQNPLNLDTELLNKIILGSLKIKANVVEKDEKEAGVRQILNFGHTAGHAIETLSFKTKKPLLHGEAVALGMIIAAKLSELVGNIDHETFQVIENVINFAGLPTKLQNYQTKEIIKLLSSDKKSIAGKAKWVLLKSIGEADWNVEVGDDLVRQAIASVVSNQ